MSGAKIGVISLGCSKNRVDTELMLGELRRAGYLFEEDPAKADVILINTCGFIDSAKQESINTILEMAEYKKTGTLKVLIVAGCLSGRYREELPEQLPEVDAFLGVTPHKDIVRAVGDALLGKRFSTFHKANVEGDYSQRVLTTPGSYAYIKIAEGCNNRCAYCAIPSIRGNLLSRPMEDIYAEAKALLGRGVGELILVAQDTSKYGLDLYQKPRIAELIDLLAPLAGLKCLRLLYCYPDGITDELLDAICRHNNVAKYMDMPIQHVDDTILKRMNRKDTKKSIYAAVDKVRQRSEDFILRTTLIVGFPGETEEQFETLKRSVMELAFDRLGCFAYSREEGTLAYGMPAQVSETVKRRRENEIMLLQKKISQSANHKRVGKIFNVLVEEHREKGNFYIGRSYGEAPGVDGAIVISGEAPMETGKFYCVKITDAGDYELYGRKVEG